MQQTCSEGKKWYNIFKDSASTPVTASGFRDEQTHNSTMSETFEQMKKSAANKLLPPSFRLRLCDDLQLLSGRS